MAVFCWTYKLPLHSVPTRCQETSRVIGGSRDDTMSTKGASKQRRDLINSEISNLRDLLPLPESARQRLSQLQIMSLACVYIRKCNYFARLFGNAGFYVDQPFEFSQSMAGFLMITTREGKLLYISENVTEYLGHSMVDLMTQGDSIYDIIDKRDHNTVQGQLLQPNYNSSSSTEERSFFCRMNVSRSFRRQAGFGDHKVMHVKGHFIQPVIRDHYGSQPVFMAICSPLITPDAKETIVYNNTNVFQSIHGLDMKFIEIARNGEFHLGYCDVDIYSKSWYDLLHPDDIHEAKEKHIQLIKSSHEMGCMLTVRVQTAFGDFIWLNMVMHIRQPFVCDNGDPAIVCINQVVSESEAQHFKMQSQLYSSHIARSPEFLSAAQDTSPPHTITQLPLEGEQLHLQAYAHVQSPEHTGSSYFGEFGVAVTTAFNGEGSRSFATVPPANSSSYYADSASEQKDSPSGKQSASMDTKMSLKADIINRLKRKMSEMQCKPNKIPRLQQGSNGDHSDGPGSFEVIGSAAIINSPFLYGESDSCDGGVYGPASLVASSLQLSMKAKDIDLPVLLDEPKVSLPRPTVNTTTMTSFQQPPTPLTPDSVTGNEQTEMTNLTIELPDVATLPPSILTPAASPANSTSSYCSNSPAQPMSAEQCVPSDFMDFEETSLFHDMDTDIQKEKQSFSHNETTEAQPKKPHDLLPILDLQSLETFLSSVEDHETLTVPEAHTKKVSSKVQVKQNVALPSVKGQDNGLSQLSENQLSDLVVGVTELLLNFLNSSETSLDVSGLTGGFMLIPEQSASSKLDTDMAASPDALVPELDDELLADVQLEASPSHGTRIELHQLTESALAPSYGSGEQTSSDFTPEL